MGCVLFWSCPVSVHAPLLPSCSLPLLSASFHSSSLGFFFWFFWCSFLAQLLLFPFFSAFLVLLASLTTHRSPIFCAFSPLAFSKPTALFGCILHPCAAFSAPMEVSAPSIVGLPEELFALIAPHLTLWEVCQLRATCRKIILRCSAVLAGGCEPTRDNIVRSDNRQCVPAAVLAWAVGSSSGRYTTSMYW